MKEKILALLTEKFAGVRKDGLNQLAGALAMQVDTEQDAAAVVGKFTADGVAKFIAEWRKEADAEITKANKTHEDGLRKKYEFAEKKTEPATPPAPAAEGNLDAAAIQKMMTDAIAAATKPLLEKVAAMETGNVAKSRLERLNEKLTGCNHTSPHPLTLGTICGAKVQEFGSTVFCVEMRFHATAQPIAKPYSSVEPKF
jgi:hypothetical protein